MLTCQQCIGNSVSSTGAANCTSTCAFGARDGTGGLGVCRYIVLYYYHIFCLVVSLNSFYSVTAWWGYSMMVLMLWDVMTAQM